MNVVNINMPRKKSKIKKAIQHSLLSPYLCTYLKKENTEYAISKKFIKIKFYSILILRTSAILTAAVADVVCHTINATSSNNMSGGRTEEKTLSIK